MDARSQRMTNWMPERSLARVGFLVDTNCINSRQRIAAMNQLEAWAAGGLIELLTTQVAQNEALAGDDAVRRAKAYRFMFTQSAMTDEADRSFLRKIEPIIFPKGAATQNQRNDVEIVFNAAKYMRTLVTNDGASRSQPGGILGNRLALSHLGISIMTPHEAVDHVRQEIEARDYAARKMFEIGAGPLPEWFGKD